MSQYNFGNLESPLSGTALINTHLEPWRDALHSLHAGSSRPSYAIASMMWIDNTTNPWVLKVFDGADDIILGYLNTSTNTFLGAGISAFGATLIDDADDSAARTTLGLGTIATENTAPANKGGTGQSSYTVGDLLYASGTTALSKLAVGTNGHVLTLAAGVPSWAAPSSGVFGSSYSSSQTSYTAGNTYTFAHGFGAVPKMFWVDVVCTTTQSPLTSGDVFVLSGGQVYNGTNNTTQGSVKCDATNISATVSANGLFYNGTALTASNFRLVGRAFN